MSDYILPIALWTVGWMFTNGWFAEKQPRHAFWMLVFSAIFWPWFLGAEVCARWRPNP